MPNEQRREQRARTLKSGKIVLDNGGVMDCVIRDSSARGARLRIGAPTPLPKSFQLFFAANRTIARVELRWQRATDAGVEFLEQPKLTELFKGTASET